MTHRAPSSTVSLNAYRAANPVFRCVTANCSEQAVVRCLHCGKTSCSRHALVDGYCVDCEMALSNVEVRGGWIGASIAAVGAITSMYTSGLALLPLTIIFGGVFALLGVWTTAVGRALARNSFKAKDKLAADELVLDGAEVNIAPRLGPVGASRPRRRRIGSGGHSAGAMPSVPMYQRTYGAG
jgi:hypothetical protein